MATFDVYLTEPAKTDLRDIARYISMQLYAPDTAHDMIQAIEASIAQLETLPLAFPLVKDTRLAALGYRLLPVKNYLVFYIVEEKKRFVDVDRILYNRRDWQNIL